MGAMVECLGDMPGCRELFSPEPDRGGVAAITHGISCWQSVPHKFSYIVFAWIIN